MINLHDLIFFSDEKDKFFNQLFQSWERFSNGHGSEFFYLTCKPEMLCNCCWRSLSIPYQLSKYAKYGGQSTLTKIAHNPYYGMTVISFSLFSRPCVFDSLSLAECGLYHKFFVLCFQDVRKVLEHLGLLKIYFPSKQYQARLTKCII